MKIHRKIGAAAAVVGVALSVVLSGCSSGPSVPDGWKNVETGWLSISIPQDWTEDPDEATEYWTTMWEDGNGKAATIQLGVNPTAAVWGYDMERSQFIANVQFGDGIPGFNLKSQSEPVKESNLEIGRVDYTYEDGDGNVNEGVYWAASNPTAKIVGEGREIRTVAVIFTGKTLSKDTVRLIQESIRVIDSDATMPPSDD